MLSNREIITLYDALTQGDLTLDTLLSAACAIRNKYLDEAPLKCMLVEENKVLNNYASALNRQFGSAVLRPSGNCGRDDLDDPTGFKEKYSFNLAVPELILYREESFRYPMMDHLGWYKDPEGMKKAYAKLCSGKYKGLVAELRSFDWESENMKFLLYSDWRESPAADIIADDPILTRMSDQNLFDKIVVRCRDSVYDLCDDGVARLRSNLDHRTERKALF